MGAVYDGMHNTARYDGMENPLGRILLRNFIAQLQQRSV